MLNKKRKGFTIVELVIVIAVIAVLAAVLIPTFSNVVDRANESAALQEVQNAYIDALAKALGSKLTGESFTSENGFTFTFSDETGQNATIKGPNGFNYSAKVENGVVVLGPATGGNGGTGETGGAGDDEEELLQVLTEGGTFTLAKDMTIDEALTIAAEATAEINLDGHTLILADPSTESKTSDVITVSGTLNINGGNGGSVDIAYPNNEDAVDSNCGICVGGTGTLKLDEVSITCNRYWNIQNQGTVNLSNSTVTVNDGIGINNEGTVTIENSQFAVNGEDGVDNFGGTVEISNTDFTVTDGWFGVYNEDGKVTITGGKFVANGEGVGPIQCEGGTLNVTGTKFSEGSDFVSYHALAPITVTKSETSGGTGTLENVTVIVSSGNTSANVTSSSSLTITGGSGSYSGPFACSSGTIKIEGGTFGGTAFETLSKDVDTAKNTLCYYPTNKSWVVTCTENVMITLSK